MGSMQVKSRTKLSQEGLALAAVLRSHRILFEEVERRLRDEVDLSLALFEALHVLAQGPEDRLRMVDVTRRMCVSKSNVTQLVDKLEAQGFVARVQSPTDRRLVYAMLTERGREAAKRGEEIFNSSAKEDFARFMTKGEIEKISSGLTKVITALEPDSVVSNMDD
jgi:DNA-binding MarR family transcriptional regulator